MKRRKTRKLNKRAKELGEENGMKWSEERKRKEKSKVNK